MIAYETLVQTIADWKAGVRPTAPTPPSRPALAVVGQPEVYDDIESGVVDVDEAEPEPEWSEETETEQQDDDYQ